jgi:hypothetical protein
MGDTVEALSYKTDVKARVGDAISDKREAILGKKDAIVNRVTGAAPDGDALKGNVQQAVSVAQENPLGLAIGALAVGFLAGMVIPATRMEDERLGPMSDQVKSQTAETAQHAIEHGKAVAQDTFQAAAQAAQDSAQLHGQELTESAKQDAQVTASAIRSS